MKKIYIIGIMKKKCQGKIVIFKNIFFKYDNSKKYF